jgi:neutral ceramidase
MNLEIGLSKRDITCFIPGIGMMGYGQHHNTVKEIATPLWARVLFIRNHNSKFIMVHLEQAFVTLAIKEEVLKRITTLYPDWGIGLDNLVISAQHTHSAPGGYSHYPFYNFTIPGFQKKIFEKIVSSIIEAITEASQRTESAKVSWGRTTIGADKEVAFNRSILAHALNPEAKYTTLEEKHLAVDRAMDGVSFVNQEGKCLAFLNWFGVHCTSVSSFNNRIHHDNKGIAAELYEKNHPGTMAFFFQASAGDVSPNFIWDKKIKLMRGKFKDQYESTEFNGEIQFREAEKIECSKSLGQEFKFFHTFFNMALEVCPPAHGVAFFRGTDEGPGVSKQLGDVVSIICKIVKKYNLIQKPEFYRDFYEAQGNKDILLDHRNGSFIGIPLKVWKTLPPLPEPSLEALRKTAKANALETLPWVPPILPFQLLIMGELAIAFVPGEITVMSGRRLKNQILHDLQSIGVTEVIISSYSNAFMGYIVTPEEYDKQCYEGGHTIYGRNTLTGVLKAFSILTNKALGKESSFVAPLDWFHFPPEELEKRSI